MTHFGGLTPQKARLPKTEAFCYVGCEINWSEDPIYKGLGAEADYWPIRVTNEEWNYRLPEM